MSDSRQYELVYVVSPDVTEDGVAELHSRIEEIVTQLSGSIENTDNWGRRRLAYEINRHREGTYVLQLINGPGEMVAELDRRLRVMDQLLRHLIVRVDEDLRKAARARARRKAKQGKFLASRDAARSSASSEVAESDAKAAPQDDAVNATGANENAASTEGGGNE